MLIWLDPRAILFDERRPIRLADLDGILQRQIIRALATRYNIHDLAVMKLYLSDDLAVHQFGRLRISQGGDTMRTAALNTPGEDTRDATFVRVWLPTLYQSCAHLTCNILLVPTTRRCMCTES